MDEIKQNTIIVIGGGLVGLLNAISLAKRGFIVEVYEMRSDIRLEDAVHGRSINLTISSRGEEALRAVGLEDVLEWCVPIYGRQLHDADGKMREMLYGHNGQCISSVSRRRLNEILLTAADKEPNIRLFFKHKFVRGNLDTKEATFIRGDDTEVTTTGALLIGCDGSHSALRQCMCRNMRLNFSQEYIQHGYIELKIPAQEGKFQLDGNYIHIWPRDEFMMLGLPNQEDKSIVINLFMPFEMFDSITTAEQIIQFFEKQFPDALPLIGRKELVTEYANTKPESLLSIQCYPYHYKDSAVLMGDACHAMVPFYGQGMNCGFEDCVTFSNLLEKHGNDFGPALSEFTLVRNPDAKAICALAKDNYDELRSLVNKRTFMARKRLDRVLSWLFPTMWKPLYTLVSFTNTRYHKCVERKESQDKILNGLFALALAVMGMLGVAAMSCSACNHSI